MSTDAQILANRLNAQKSTGPRTIEGKAAVSQNAVRHGLSAERDVIASESQADFDLFHNQLLDELSPLSPMESILAERIVTLSWRLEHFNLLYSHNHMIQTIPSHHWLLPSQVPWQ